jgi:hypothetical protein
MENKDYVVNSVVYLKQYLETLIFLILMFN